jgi:hypothetical protein
VDATLDLLTAVHLRLDDIPAAVATLRRREAAIASLPMVALIAAGNLPGASQYADRLARLPFNREEGLLGLARRLKVDAFAGHFDAVLRDATQFGNSWDRLGEPVVPNLASSAGAVATVHGILGHDELRARWLRLADDLNGPQPTITTWAWAPTFDAIVALRRVPYRVRPSRDRSRRLGYLVARRPDHLPAVVCGRLGGGGSAGPGRKVLERRAEELRGANPGWVFRPAGLASELDDIGHLGFQ